MTTVSYGYLHLPEEITIEEENNSQARFVWTPFERGYGHTIGNLLRRILLSSIESPAITSIKILPFIHEFMAIDGIVEDMTDIVLNMKDVLIKYKSDINKDEIIESGKEYTIDGVLDISKKDIEEAGGAIKVTAEDLLIHELIEIVNKDKVLFTVTSPNKLEVKIKFKTGRGYVPVSKMSTVNLEDGEILIDGLFSPVKLVNYKIEKSRVGSFTDFDKLIIDVLTDGRVSARGAMSHAIQIATHCFSKVDSVSTEEIKFASNNSLDEKNRKKKLAEELMTILSKEVTDMEITVRASNCLKDAGIKYFGELLLKDEASMMKMKNLGKKSLVELKELVSSQREGSFEDLTFGMDLSNYGITEENVKEKIEAFLSEGIVDIN